MARWASAHVERAERVRLLDAYIKSADRFPDKDALPEAMFELADVEVQAFGSADEESRGRGIARLHAIVDRFGQTCWGKLAAERLCMLDPQPPSTSHVMVAP